jgi:uncharacterized protein
MAFPAEALVLAPLIVLSGYIVLGLGGFGSALVAMPLLALLLPIKLVVPLMLLLDFVGMATQGVRLRRDLDKRELKIMLPALLLGLLAGVTALVALPGRALLATLGVLVLVYALNSFRRRVRSWPVSAWWSLPTGLFGGLINGMYGTGGAVFAMYYTARIPDLPRMLATMSAVLMVSSGARLLLFLASGLLFQREIWVAFAGLVALVPLGIAIGHRLQGRLSASQIARLVGALLLFSGVSLLLKALG